MSVCSIKISRRCFAFLGYQRPSREESVGATGAKSVTQYASLLYRKRKIRLWRKVAHAQRSSQSVRAPFAAKCSIKGQVAAFLINGSQASQHIFVLRYFGTRPKVARLNVLWLMAGGERAARTFLSPCRLFTQLMVYAALCNQHRTGPSSLAFGHFSPQNTNRLISAISTIRRETHTHEYRFVANFLIFLWHLFDDLIYSKVTFFCFRGFSDTNLKYLKTLFILRRLSRILTP